MMWGSIVKLLDEIVIAAIISMLGFICGKTYKKIRSFFLQKGYELLHRRALVFPP